MRNYRWIGIAMFVCGLPIVAAAADPMRCEAKQLTEESRLHRCLSQCGRRDEAGVGFDVLACERLCEASFEASIARLEQKPLCGDLTEEADPNLCEAQLLKVEARHLLCNVRCTRRAERRPEVDEELCDAACEETTQAAVQNVMDKPFCSEGRM